MKKKKLSSRLKTKTMTWAMVCWVRTLGRGEWRWLMSTLHDGSQGGSAEAGASTMALLT